MSINKFCVSGHVGSEPKAYTNDNGDIFASFSLAESTFVNDEEKTVWHQVICGGNFTNTILNHVNQGDKLVVEGKASPHSYLDKEQTVVSQIKIWMTGFDFAGKKVTVSQNQPENVDDTAGLSSTEISDASTPDEGLANNSHLESLAME